MSKFSEGLSTVFGRYLDEWSFLLYDPLVCDSRVNECEDLRSEVEEPNLNLRLSQAKFGVRFARCEIVAELEDNDDENMCWERPLQLDWSFE